MSVYQEWADRVLAGGTLTRDEGAACLRTPPDDLDDLMDAVFRVRRAAFGKRVKICVLNNVRSGLCPEDCFYCSQSKISLSEISVYPLKTMDAIYQGAREAYEGAKAKRYCIVASGRGPSDRDLDHLTACIQKIKVDFPLEICCSLGLMDEPKARRLKAAGAEWVNHNLNTSERFYPNICATHTYQDRIDTVMAVKAAGMNTCSGGIIGMGESEEDVLDLAFTIQSMDIDSIPVNFLHPVKGTPLDDRPKTAWETGLRTLGLFRFLNPKKEIRSAGGREFNFGPDSYRVLYAANSIFVEGYLTTSGQSAEEAHRMIESMGFEIEK